MAKDNDPNRLSPIALRMKQDLQLSGKGERTQESYSVNWVGKTVASRRIRCVTATPPTCSKLESI